MTQFIEVPASRRSLSIRRPVCGIGINDADYITSKNINGAQVVCPHYRVWVNMINRCYSSKVQEKRPTYVGCSVVNEWLTFSNFKRWMVSQNWLGNELDKDILTIGNKVYEPSACIFVSAEINLLLTNSAAIRGDYPQGVCWSKRQGKYVSYCKVNGKQKWIGTFDSIKNAEESYLKFKSKLITDVAMSTSDNILRHALIRHAVALSDRIGE